MIGVAMWHRDRVNHARNNRGRIEIRETAMMLLRTLTVATAALGVLGWLDTATPAAAAPDTEAAPYTAVVDVPKVQMRSGAGRAFYPVGELKRGATVTVVDEYWDWYRIQAPQGVYMFVLRRDVDAKGDGTRGIVNTALTRVYAAGLNRAAADSFKFTMNLPKGQEVRIVATDGDHYKIVPPKGALVFLPPGTIKPVQAAPEVVDAAPAVPDAQPPAADDMVPLDDAGTDTSGTAASGARPAAAASGTGSDASAGMNHPDTAAVPRIETPDTAAPTPTPTLTLNVPAHTAPAVTATVHSANTPQTTPAGESTTPAPGSDATAVGATTEETTTTDAPPAPPVPAETPAVTPGLRAVELAQLPRFNLPVERQPLDQMQQAYEAFVIQAAEQGTELPLVDQRILEVRLAAIARNRQLAAALAQIQQRQQALPQIAPVKETVTDNEPFAAVGVLRASSVFSGDGMPQMFRVIDPATRRTIAYVRAAQGVDPTAALGQLVGVKGKREFDPSLNTHLITAQQVTILDAAGS